MYRVERIGSAELSRWQAFVDRQPNAGAYHHAAWYTILGECFSVQLEYTWVIDREGSVHGVLPMYISRSRFTGPHLATLEGGALADDPAAVEALYSAAECRRDELRLPYLLIRGGPDIERPVLQSSKFRRAIVDLSRGPEPVWQAFNSNHRNHIRKSLGNGLSVTCDEGSLPLFYTVYSQRLRELGTPVEGARLFSSLQQHLGPRLHVHIVRLGERVVGGMICVANPMSWSYLYGAADSRFFQLYPNEALFWFTIREACAAGVQQLDLGTSAPGSGAQRFKGKWTPTRLDVSYHYLAAASTGQVTGIDRYRRGKSLQQRVWSHLPLVVTKRIGPLLRRQLPFA